MAHSRKRGTGAAPEISASGRARAAAGPARAHEASSGALARYGAAVVLGVTVLFVAIVRLRLAGVPLERDEGEYAYAGQLILHGFPPYALAYNMKFPGTYYAYALVLALFGQSARGIHVGLMVVNLASIAAVFFLGRRLLGSPAGTFAAACFAVLSLDGGVLGAFAHATHFVVLPALVGLLVILGATESGGAAGFLAGGALLGLAALMTQQGAVFVPAGIVIAAWDAIRRGREGRVRMAAVRTAWLAAGAAGPFLILGAVLAAQGVFGRFWFWTITYARAYVGIVPANQAWSIAGPHWRAVARDTMPLWILAGAGAAALWSMRWARDARVVLTSLLAAGVAGLLPGFYFRAHYWVLVLPAVALLAAVAAAGAARAMRRLGASPAGTRLVLLAAGVAVVAGYATTEWSYCFSIEPRALSRATFGANPFPEAVDIGDYLRRHTAPDERVAVLGSEPEIYFYADRRSATGYLYTYPFMESQPFSLDMQREMTQEIEAAHPSYLVVASMTTSWIDGAFSNQPILTWSRAYAAQCYDLVGVADIAPSGTTMVWDRDAAGYQPASVNTMLTYKRKSLAPCAVPLTAQAGGG